MRNWVLSLITIFFFAMAAPASAGDAHHDGGHSGHGHNSGSSHEATGGMKHASSMAGMHTFKHQAVVDGIRAEFQVMSLAGMNMTDPEGRTHHIMVKLVKEGTDRPIADAIGKIKVIAPDKQEQTGLLKRYGDFLAANFSFAAPGKYGVICLFVEEGRKHIVKFWYPHQE
jgi:hypothetical protein